MTDVPPARRCTFPGCDREQITTGRGGLCPEHAPDDDETAGGSDPVEDDDGLARCANDADVHTDETTPPEGDSPGSNPTPDAEESGSTATEAGEYGEIDFTETASDTYPPALLDREQWMGRLDGEKMPFAPWGDADHPDGEDGKDARYKWGITDHYVDGATVARAEADHRLAGRVFLQQETDPFAFVDGDDVRDPETGDVHPDFLALLDRLGATYTDVSTSGSGVHAYYEGDLPGEQGQAVFEIDTEPWGANDDLPTVEIYANTHVCVTTGEHVAGTPADVHPWDADAVAAILDEHDARKETEPITHDTDRDRDDLADYTPEATGTDETTAEVRDILAAVDRLKPSDLRLQTTQVGTDATGWEKWDPSSYRSSSGNDSLHRPPGEAVFHDHKHAEAFGVLSLVAAEEGILSTPWDHLRGADFWDAVEAARDRGAPIPEYVGSKGADAEPVAVLPPAVRDLTTAASGWDWEHTARRGEDTLTITDARERTVGAIADAYEHGDRVLIEALPTMGKSYGSVKAAAETDEQITVVTGRGRKEQYEQIQEWCDEHGLSHYTLPSFTHDCLTANGEHGAEWADTVRDWYHRGATPKEIHASAEYVLGEPLPCQRHEGQRCPYASKWDFDPDDYDVLIGHYSHAYKSKVTSGRTVVFDEFPGAFETALGDDLQRAVSYWLETTEGVPFEDYTDLLENRTDETRRADALLWFEEHGVDPDETDVFDDPAAHAYAPLAVFTLLAGEDLGNGFERTSIPDVGVGARNRETGGVFVLRPPALEYASGVVALDGTPTREMWELSLGERLNHRQVLDDAERAEYITEALNHNYVRASEHIKPYSGTADHVNLDHDAALLEQITEAHDEKPGLITTATAEQAYEETDAVEEHVDESKHYGNVLGSNTFKEKRLGAVIGSRHYGDGYIKKWGAYAGETVERNDERGAGLSYGETGDKILTHMREHRTLQATMRFGRDGNGAVVYVATNTLPEWVPLAGEARVVSTWSDGMKQVVEALEELETATTEAVVNHPAVEIGTRQVFDHLEALRERGVLDREQDDRDGRRVVWADDGIHRVNDHGEVELDPVEIDVLDDAEVDELARRSTYTWEFINRDADPGGSLEGATDPATTTAAPTPSGGDRPPNDAD